MKRFEQNRKTRRRPIARLAKLVWLAASSIALVGCATSSKYHKAVGTHPPLNLGMQSDQPPATGTIHSVIYIGGPGSWKKKAYWDEYVVTIENRGTAPIELIGAQLYDIEDIGQNPGSDPWALEKLSERKIDRLLESGASFAMGTIAVASTGSTLALLGTWGGSSTAASALSVMPVAVAGYMVAVKVKDKNNKKAIEAEFDRRRLALPVEIAPSGSVSGCLFFPQSPGPKKLLIEYRQDGQEKLLEFDFTETPLARLHLKDEDE